VRCSSKSIRSSSSWIESRVLFVVSAKKSITCDVLDARGVRDFEGRRSFPSRTDSSVSQRSATKSLRSFSSSMESWVLRALSAMNLETRVESGDSCFRNCVGGDSGGVPVPDSVSGTASIATAVSFFLRIEALAMPTFLPNIFIGSK